MSRIDIHADDFGESVHASRDILDCILAGKLNSISVLCNMSCFEACVDMYRKELPNFPGKILISVHINIMEGSCLCDSETIPDLVNKEGHFSSSWEKLFLRSFLPGRKKLKEQLKAEMKAQILTLRKAFPEMEKLRIDSHQHIHMIPAAASALAEVLKEEKWEAEYIRDAREPIVPFLKKTAYIKSYRPINLIKNLILNFCSVLMRSKLKEFNTEPMLLWGLIMSGHMDQKRVHGLWEAMVKKAEQKNCRLEILFHPGQVLTEEISAEFSQKDAIAFHVSEDRQIEKEAVMTL